MDITDALDSYLQAKIKVGQWEREFNLKFYEPMAKVLIATAMRAANSIPPQNRPQVANNENQMRGE